MNTTTQSILQEIAQTGQAVILTHKSRETHAALDLIKAGICHQSSTHHGYIIIKFGARPITI